MNYGNQNAARKLTSEDVRHVRELHALKKREIDRINQSLSLSAIAEKFGVSKRCIERVVARETWSIQK